MNVPFSLLVFAGGVLLVWNGIAAPPGGLVGTVGRVLRGEAQPAARQASTAEGLLQFVPAFFTPSAGAGVVPATYNGARRSYPGLGAVRPHVKTAAEVVGGMFGVTSILGWGLRDNASDHPLGLALDFMVYTDATKGTGIATYCQQNAAALGVTYIIWNQSIWSVGRAAEGWRRMPDRGNPTANHFDHVHVSFRASGASSAPTPAPAQTPGTVAA